MRLILGVTEGVRLLSNRLPVDWLTWQQVISVVSTWWGVSLSVGVFYHVGRALNGLVTAGSYNTGLEKNIALNFRILVVGIFKASALWADAFYKSKCPSVCPFVCLSNCPSVRQFTFEIPFKRLFAPPSQSRMSNIFRDSESLGKSNGKKWCQIWTFLFENCLKSSRNFYFFLYFLPYKTWWKPRFPMDQRPLVKGHITNFGIFLDVFEFLRFGWFFLFFKKIGFWSILCPTKHGGNHAFRWIRDLWSKGVSLILSYF